MSGRGGGGIFHVELSEVRYLLLKSFSDFSDDLVLYLANPFPRNMMFFSRLLEG